MSLSQCWFAALSAALLAFPVTGQLSPGSGVVAGVVDDSRWPMPNWLVVLRSIDRAVDPPILRVTHSDLAGRYRFEGLPAGKYSIAIPPAGFNGQRRSIVVSGNGPIELNLTASVPVICECVHQAVERSGAAAGGTFDSRDGASD